MHIKKILGAKVAQRFWTVRAVVIALLLALGATMVGAAETIFYPRPESDDDPRVEYPLRLLGLALQKSGVAFDLWASKDRMVQGRAITEVVARSGRVDIVWSMTSREREQLVLPIRIPIYKGLIGWRLPLVHRDQLNLFAGVKNLDGMRGFEAGQGHDWPDTDILRSNGLAVQTSPNYEGIFLKLKAKRFDYFPRSVAEIWAEADLHAGNGIVIDPWIALHYPAAFYFFVNKENTRGCV
jgi:hypothetical protein